MFAVTLMLLVRVCVAGLGLSIPKDGPAVSWRKSAWTAMSSQPDLSQVPGNQRCPRGGIGRRARFRFTFLRISPGCFGLLESHGFT